MELITFDSRRMETGPADVNIDFSLGEENDFQIERSGTFDACGIYVPGTELGGLIEYRQTKSTTDVALYRGLTWRGLLSQSVILPDGDYLTVSGDVHDIIKSLLADALGGFFISPSGQAGVAVSGYSFSRYCTLLDGLNDLLESVGRRLSIIAKRPAPGQPVQVSVSSVPIQRLSGSYDDDTGLALTFAENDMGTNHLICLGQGELSDRLVRHLYIQEDGSIGAKQTYFGFNERVAVFDYPSAESEQELIRYGIRRLKEIGCGPSLLVEAGSDVTLELGDIVVRKKGSLTVEAPVTGKVVTIEGGLIQTQYKVEEK